MRSNGTLLLLALLGVISVVQCFKSSTFIRNHAISKKIDIPSQSIPQLYGNRELNTKAQLFGGASELISKATNLFVAKPLLSALYSTLGFLLGYILLKVKNELWKPSRTYDKDANSVGREYDAWTSEGILEYYWGEHIHLGYYSPEEMAKGYKKKNFIKAKYDFIDEMVKFGKLQLNNGKSLKILDVGCGIGGTSRYLASNIPGSTVTGITLSSKQVERATQLAKDRNIPNANFQVMDALNMTYPDNSFDVVWACESGEHMPDKKRYVEEMTRVLKPGGRIVIATWCQRDDEVKPFVEEERKMLDFLYAEWTHPYFVSIAHYAKLMWGTRMLTQVQTDDWTTPTIASWKHSIWVGVFDPWPVAIRPHLWYKCFRDGLTLYRMHEAFESGLMQYGMMTAQKKPSTLSAPQ